MIVGINTFYAIKEDYQPIHIRNEAKMLHNVTHKPNHRILEKKKDKFEKKKHFDSWETLCFNSTTRGSSREWKEHVSLLLPEKQHVRQNTFTVQQLALLAGRTVIHNSVRIYEYQHQDSNNVHSGGFLYQSYLQKAQ